MTTFARVAAVLTILVVGAFILLLAALYAITMPIDDGKTVGHLATAGIMSGLA